MSTHFKWYPSSEEETVPWFARYQFPSQANKSVKMTPRIPPKGGNEYRPGQVIRLEFPAQGYVNPLNTTLEFDVTISGVTGESNSTNAEYIVRFQNNIQSIFSRVRLLYGSTPIEDMDKYNVLVRLLTEWTSTNQHMSIDQTSIAEGIGGVVPGFGVGANRGYVNVRQRYIQGVGHSTAAGATESAGFGKVPQSTGKPPISIVGNSTTRRYQVNLALGLMTQDKLIPTKWMASQLAIEITLAPAAECLYMPLRGSSIVGTPTYTVTDVNLIPEVLEFDASYDAMFLKGLQTGGVPIKISSWHVSTFSSASSSRLNLQVQEASRSVKAIFAIQRRAQSDITVDSHAAHFDTSNDGQSCLKEAQYRIGARYFPASPMQGATSSGFPISNGGCEFFLELQKALNIVGDYRLSCTTNTLKWALQSAGGFLHEYDYSKSLNLFSANGVPSITSHETATNSFCGDLGSACFTVATDLETSNGVEISGLNAEEQSSITVILNYDKPQVTGSSGVASLFEVFTYFDAMLILKENNVIDMVQ